MKLLFDDESYLDYDFFAEDKDQEGIRNHSKKMIVTRSEQRCLSDGLDGMHQIEAGTRARFDKAVIDGVWASFYTCVRCLDRMLTEDYSTNDIEVARDRPKIQDDGEDSIPY